LRFQTLQALAYQSLGTLAYILLNVSMFIIAFGMMGFMFLSIPLFGTQSGTTEDVGGAGGFFLAVFIIVFVILMIIQFLMIFAGPLYILLGLWAGLRVLKGKDFRYPILGKMIADRLDEPAVASPT
jgi:hypothetical protein